MNRYILIRRLRGPAFLLLTGVIALLHQTGMVHHIWPLYWPLALILWGVLLLAERAAMEVEGYPPPYPGGYPPAPNPGMGPVAGPGTGTTEAGTSMVPANPGDVERTNGGQS